MRPRFVPQLQATGSVWGRVESARLARGIGLGHFPRVDADVGYLPSVLTDRAEAEPDRGCQPVKRGQAGQIREHQLRQGWLPGPRRENEPDRLRDGAKHRLVDHGDSER